jgi:hypothetical protein
MTNDVTLHALNGSNPLGFLAALGTLRLLSQGHDEVRMRWRRPDGTWRPQLQGSSLTEDTVCDRLIANPQWAPAEGFTAALGKNLTVPAETFRPFAQAACLSATASDRRMADFATAFGCELCVEEDKGRIEYTQLCFITGSGHQDFLGTISALQTNVTRAHVYDALFGDWRKDKGSSMRWDPGDAAEYALQWDDPGPKGAWAVWGANRLAAEALPLFTTAPTRQGLRTTGFQRRKRQVEFTWPIWSDFLRLESIRSLLSLAQLQEDAPNRRDLIALGIDEVYRAQRLRIGEGANFKVSFSAPRSV